MASPLPETLAESPPSRSLGPLIRLAWPIVVSRSTQVVVGVCDAWMVADLGQNALAATTTGAMNSAALFILPMGVCFVVSSFAAQLTGKGDPEGARRYGFYGLLVAAATQVLCLAGLPLVGPTLGLAGHAPAVHAAMTDYLTVRLCAGGAAVGLEALSNYYGGLGNTRLPMRCNLAAMVLNVALNWVLIDGHLGAPALGVFGAALATALSSWVAFLMLLALFLWHGRRVGRIVPRLSAHEFGRMLRFGLPAGLNWFFEFFAFLFFVNVVVGGLGTTSLAALMAVLQINAVAFMPAFGLASAGAILVGQHIGAGRKDDVPRLVGLTFAAAGTWQGLVGLAYFTWPELLFRPFAPGSTEEARVLMDVGVRMLTLSAAWQLFDAAAGTLAEALRAAGDTAFTLWARVVLSWAVFVPGSWYSVRGLGASDTVAVVWVIAYLAMLAGVLWWRFRSGAWRRIELVEEGLVT